METEIAAIVVRGHGGTVAVGAAQNEDSPIRLGGEAHGVVGLLNAAGEPVHYIGPAGDVERWAVENGMEYERYVIRIDLEGRTVRDWRYERR